MSIHIDISHTFSDFALRVRFEAGDGVTAIFGASGAGKTSVLNAVAGLLKPQQGRIEVAGREFFNSDTGMDIPIHARGVGYVFQDARIFPHMTVRQNLSFAGRFQSSPATAAQFDEMVAILGIENLLGRKPSDLSGGEKQRVAIGRALLSNPQLLVLDEPLAALDQERRAEVLPYLARLRDQAKLPVLYVSHARAEVRALADTVVVMSAGQVTAHGPVGEVLGRGGVGPSVTLAVEEKGQPKSGLVQLSTSAGDFLSLQDRVPVTGARSITIVASDIVLSRATRDQIASPNVFEAQVGELEKAGPGIMNVPLFVGAAKLVARCTIEDAGRIKLAPGAQVRAIIARFTVA